MERVPVLIVGGGPVGMTVACDLASRGIHCLLIERNVATTSHPKMDITNGRSMELFGRIGLVDALRAVAVPEDHPFDVSWITTLSGHELHRFTYPSVTAQRREILEKNDGSQSREPGMRVSQVEIEPVLKWAIDASPNVDVRFGTELEQFEARADEVIATVNEAGRSYLVACHYLIGCDGGGSRVRDNLGISLSGEARIMPRYMTHFRSNARGLLQRWGKAWHYQSLHGTLIAQNDQDTWTLHSRFPAGQTPETVDPSVLLTRFAGCEFEHEVLVANHWSPHLLVADGYGGGRVFLAGDAAHQYIPTGGYGMNTGIGDAFDISWKLAAVLNGFGGPRLLASYEVERRPVGLRNRAASRRHNDIRMKIAGEYNVPLLYENNPRGDAARQEAGERIRTIGNAENECRGIEFGYVYAGSPIVAAESCTNTAAEPFLDYWPTTEPGARLPSTILKNGTALYDLLSAWFTILAFGDADPSVITFAAAEVHMPLKVVRIREENLYPIYEAALVLVRPDHHVAWRGNQMQSVEEATKLVRRTLGW